MDFPRTISTAQCAFLSCISVAPRLISPDAIELGNFTSLVVCNNSVGRGSHGAWQRFERGEISLFPFYEQFGKDLSDVVSGNEWYKAYCRRNKISKCQLPVWNQTHDVTLASLLPIACPSLPESLHVDGREVCYISSGNTLRIADLAYFSYLAA